MRFLFFRFLIFVGVALLNGAAGHAQSLPATITFDNRSGQPALVKLIGPSKRQTSVPLGQSRTVNASGGRYFIRVRYRAGENKKYTYAQGDPFEVTQTVTARSVITITLYPVVNGNYATQPISPEEFDQP
jgi:hypothetical protein